MSFAEWIKEQIDALRAMIVPDEKDTETVDSPVEETRTPDKCVWRFPSNSSHLSRLRKSIERFSSEAGLDAPACDEIGLVINEALANVIRHAYHNAKDRPIEMTAEQLHPGVRISIRDWGNGVNPSKEVPTEKDPMIPGGLGLICMKQLMDGAQFFPQPDGMLLVMTRTAKGSNAAAVDQDGKRE